MPPGIEQRTHDLGALWLMEQHAREAAEHQTEVELSLCASAASRAAELGRAAETVRRKLEQAERATAWLQSRAQERERDLAALDSRVREAERETAQRVAAAEEDGLTSELATAEAMELVADATDLGAALASEAEQQERREGLEEEGRHRAARVAAETRLAAYVDAAKSPDRRAARLEAAAERDAREIERCAREEQLAADERRRVEEEGEAACARVRLLEERAAPRTRADPIALDSRHAAAFADVESSHRLGQESRRRDAAQREAQAETAETERAVAEARAVAARVSDSVREVEASHVLVSEELGRGERRLASQTTDARIDDVLARHARRSPATTPAPSSAGSDGGGSQSSLGSTPRRAAPRPHRQRSDVEGRSLELSMSLASLGSLLSPVPHARTPAAVGLAEPVAEDSGLSLLSGDLDLKLSLLNGGVAKSRRVMDAAQQIYQIETGAAGIRR